MKVWIACVCARKTCCVSVRDVPVVWGCGWCRDPAGGKHQPPPPSSSSCERKFFNFVAFYEETIGQRLCGDLSRRTGASHVFFEHEKQRACTGRDSLSLCSTTRVPRAPLPAPPCHPLCVATTQTPRPGARLHAPRHAPARTRTRELAIEPCPAACRSPRCCWPRRRRR